MLFLGQAETGALVHRCAM